MGDSEGPDLDVGSPDDADASSGSEHLVDLLSDLRHRLETGAPDDRDRRPDAAELIRQAQERIVTLEQMLAWSRAREAELTSRTVRDEMKVAHLESVVSELNSIAKKRSEAEEGRLRAETTTAELQQQLTAARADLQAKEAEALRLSARCREFESDLETLADQLASAVVTRTRAERLERERDVALERARAESRLALDERLRAADVERQLETMRERLRELEPRATDETGAEADETVVLEDGGTIEDDEVVDVTEEPEVAEDDAAVAQEEAIVWGEPAHRGFVGWLRRGLAGDDDERDDRP